MQENSSKSAAKASVGLKIKQTHPSKKTEHGISKTVLRISDVYTVEQVTGPAPRLIMTEDERRLGQAKREEARDE